MHEAAAEVRVRDEIVYSSTKRRFVIIIVCTSFGRHCRILVVACIGSGSVHRFLPEAIVVAT